MKKFIMLVVLVLVVSIFVSCEISYSSTLNDTKKWAENVANVYMDYLSPFVGKTFQELANSSSSNNQQWEAKLEELGQVLYPYNTQYKMKDVASQQTYVDKDSFYIVIYVPLPEEENDYAESQARVKGAKYYVISLIRIQTNGDLESGDANVIIKNIMKDVYVSSKLPQEQ